MTTDVEETAPVAADEAEMPACPVVEGYEDQPFCRVAQKVAVARLSQLEAAHSSADTVLDILRGVEALNDGSAEQLALACSVLTTLIGTVTEGPAPELVPRDDALLAVVEALQERISAEPAALLEQALWALNAIASGGWLLVRQEDMR